MWMEKMRRKARLTQEQYALLSAYLDQLRHPQTAGSAGISSTPTSDAP